MSMFRSQNTDDAIEIREQTISKKALNNPAFRAYIEKFREAIKSHEDGKDLILNVPSAKFNSEQYREAQRLVSILCAHACGRSTQEELVELYGKLPLEQLTGYYMGDGTFNAVKAFSDSLKKLEKLKLIENPEAKQESSSKKGLGS